MEVSYNYVGSKSSIPKIECVKERPKKTEVHLVVLQPQELANSQFEVFQNNGLLIADVKKNRFAQTYGGVNDFYELCYFSYGDLTTRKEALNLGATACRKLLADKRTQVHIEFEDNSDSIQIADFLSGFFLANYKFDQKSYIDSDSSKIWKRIEKVTIISSKYNHDGEYENFSLNAASSSLFAREIQNARTNNASPAHMYKLCNEIAASSENITIEHIKGADLQKKGFGLIHSVARGSKNEAYLVLMNYHGNSDSGEESIALVGKGVCFDSGGINIKTNPSIANMYNDKGGACIALGVFKSIVELKMKVNVVYAATFVENMTGSDATHVSDIVKSYKGLTVEISNTDAEGRLILADTLTYVQERYKPHTIFDFATLTGATKFGLGEKTGAVFTNDDELAEKIQNACHEACEKVWRMPIDEEHINAMKDSAADLINSASNRFGGGSKAAAFLQFFINKNVKWAHFDLAGPAFSGSDEFIYTKGGTGYGV